MRETEPESQLQEISLHLYLLGFGQCFEVEAARSFLWNHVSETTSTASLQRRQENILRIECTLMAG